MFVLIHVAMGGCAQNAVWIAGFDWCASWIGLDFGFEEEARFQGCILEVWCGDCFEILWEEDEWDQRRVWYRVEPSQGSGG